VSQRRKTLRAFLAALLLHLLLGAVTWNADMIGTWSPSEPATAPQVVEVVLLADPSSSSADAPQTYTSVPERQDVELPPEDPDFLALRDSRAADRIAGGEADARPRAETTGELSQMAIRRDTGGHPGGVTVTPVPPGDDGTGEEAGGAAGGVEPRPGPDPAATAGRDLVDGSAETDRTTDSGTGEGTGTAAELKDLLARSTPSILDRTQGRPGDRGFEYDQQSISMDAGDLIQFGDFALSTVAWDFAPWLERFKQDFLPNWIPPYAYTHLGVIDGMTVLKLVIQPDGTLSVLEVVEEEGHESLHRASLAAMRATAPLTPLPGHFPDPELVMTVKLIYSAR